MKTYTLFKRGADGKPMAADTGGFRERPWHFVFKFRGARYARCLDTPDATNAQKVARMKAEAIKAAVIAGEMDRLDATKTRHAAPAVEPTLGELYAAYDACPATANARTRKHNKRAMTNLLARVHAQTANDLLQTPFCELVNADTAEAWFQLKDLKPQTANSLWRQAASLCAARARWTYAKLKIDRPCLGDFERVGRICQQPVSKSSARPPSDTIIAQTLAAWEACEDRNLFLAIGHMLAFGLRIGEVEQARQNWWVVKYGGPMLCATGEFKHNHGGYFELPALDPWYSIMRTKAYTRGWLSPTPTDDYIITGSMTYRTDGLERAVSAWLRDLGWETTKTNHALRAYSGSQVCLKYGVYAASQFLRHSSVKVTEQHYMYLLKHPLIQSFRESCPAQWATFEPHLRIVEQTR